MNSKLEWQKLFTSLRWVAAVWVLLFCPGANTLYSQKPFSPEQSEPLNEVWRWRPIDVLATKGVRCMTDDAENNMWFGLDKGIMRYNGYDWTLFDQQPFLRFPVGILTKHSNGQLYAGSDAGLLTFENGAWVKIFPKSDTIQTQVTAIHILPDGTIFAGIRNGLLMVKGNDIAVFTVLQRANFFMENHSYARVLILPDEVLFQRNFGRVDNIFLEKDKLLWVFFSRNNDGKLLKFNFSDTLNQVVHNFEISEDLGGFKLANRNKILRTSNNELWVINGFYKSGILRKKGVDWELIKPSAVLGGDELHTDLMEPADGSIWVGGLGRLYVFKNGRWRVFAAPDLPIPSSRIIFHEARNGMIWIAGIQGDVFRLSYHNRQWVKYPGLNFQLNEPNGNEWFISVRGQVVLHQNGKWHAYDHSNGLIDAPVRLISTRNGRLWAAGSHKGVAATAYLNNNYWVKQTHPTLSWGIDPRSVFQDSQGSLWFGASVDRQDALGQVSGVLQLKNPDEDTFEWRHHTQSDGIAQHNVYGIAQSPDGAMWLGGTNLLRWNGLQWQTLPDKEPFNEFVDIVHSRQNLWVGSRYYGLFRFDGKNWTQFTTQNGLPGNTIVSIFEEYPNKAWVITDRDMAFFDGNRWFPGPFMQNFKMPREGGDILVDDQGNIWTNKSLREWKRRAFPFSVTPARAFEDFWTIRYQRDKTPPKTKITLYSEKVDRSGNILISWTGRDFWEETPADMLTYSYRLNEGEWSVFSTETNVAFTRLGSGRHTFEIKARDHDFNIETVPATITFIVAPPLWRQTWFIALVVLLLIIIGFYEARLIKHNRSLSKLNTSLSSVNRTLEARQQKIELQKDTILRQKEELEKKNIDLEDKTAEITAQRDQLKEMVNKVEELSNVKQRFFTNISHEFRTPLTLIMGSIERLRATSENPGSAKPEQAYQTIQRNSKRLLRLINQILEIRNMERGKLDLNPTQGDIVTFARDIIDLFSDLAKNQLINLNFETHINQKIMYFDHDKVEKILFNLLSNAFKYTPAGGSISLIMTQMAKANANTGASGQIQQNNLAETDGIVFEVSDTGKGISAKHLPHIFERFYRTEEASLNSKYDSSGIGLSYVKDLVTIHQGEITVESGLNKGTRFTFWIPILPYGYKLITPEEESFGSQKISDEVREEIDLLNRSVLFVEDPEPVYQQNVQELAKRPEKLMVLLVEDEPELREFIREILEEDFEVLVTRNGTHGYEKALAYQPDIIITDVMMPEMDGYELCAKLKANLATNHIPVVMLTARIAPENKFEGYQSGADAYIEKPFSTEYLKLRLQNLISSKEKIRNKIMRDLITQPSEIVVHTEDDKILRKMQEVLEENISDSDFDVESMSQHFYLSRCHFSRKIKQITGLTPKEIIDSYRLKRASQLLQQKMTITEVAYMVGFDHPNSFTRAFRKFYNMTPSEFASQN